MNSPPSTVCGAGFKSENAQAAEETTVAEKSNASGPADGGKGGKTAESKKLQLMVESIKRKAKALDTAAPGKRQRKD